MFCVSAEYKKAFAGLGLASCRTVAQFFLNNSDSDKKVFVKQATLPLPDGTALPVFFKQYRYEPASWKFLGRRSKAACEFQNYAVFAKLGIACAEPIACGEERDSFGRLSRAFILTREILNAKTLTEFVQDERARKTEAGTRDIEKQLIKQLAEIVRRLHAAGFFHNDLVWRNILVTQDSHGETRLWLIDCPRGKFDHWSPLRHRRRLKDLASLDKVASQLCSRGERLMFLKTYLAKPRLDSETKQFAKQILTYRKSRWPEDWK